MTNVLRFIVSASLLLNFGFNSVAQTRTNQIRVRSDKELIYFSPRSSLNDSICITNETEFYVFATREAQDGFQMTVENGRILNTRNDSLFVLEHLPGMQYEIVYLLDGDSINPTPQKRHNKKLTALLNGSTALQKDRIRIKIFREKGEDLIYEKIFCIKD